MSYINFRFYFNIMKNGWLSRYIDMAETLCQKRALEAFRLDPAKWGGNKFCSIMFHRLNSARN